MKVQNSLAELRSARGLSAADLASRIDVSRQTVYAIESGDYAPNTSVALKLAQALCVTVEEIFHLEAETALPQREEAELLEGGRAGLTGRPVCLGRVDGHLIATFPEPTAWSLPRADGMITGPTRKGRQPSKVYVELCGPAQDYDKRLLMSGCDPAISVLARHLGHQGVDLIAAHGNSTRSLELLQKGNVHVAC